MVWLNGKHTVIRKMGYSVALVAFALALTSQFFLHEEPVEFFIPENDHCIACQFAHTSVIEPDVITIIPPNQAADSIPCREFELALPFEKPSPSEARAPPIFPL